MTTPFDKYVPSVWTRAGLEAAGYSGFMTFASLVSPPVTKGPGIYVVLRSSTSAPVFLERSPAGKVLDHTEGVDVLQRSWLDETEVVYIGKAGWGARRDGVWRRLKQYRRTGAGRSDNHSGGTWIWQLTDSAELLVCWIEVADTCDEFVHGLERHLIADFKTKHGARPFANRRD